MQLNVKLDKAEAKRLARIAQYYGLNGCAVVRMLLKREDDALASAKKQASRKSNE